MEERREEKCIGGAPCFAVSFLFFLPQQGNYLQGGMSLSVAPGGGGSDRVGGWCPPSQSQSSGHPTARSAGSQTRVASGGGGRGGVLRVPCPSSGLRSSGEVACAGPLQTVRPRPCTLWDAQSSLRGSICRVLPGDGAEVCQGPHLLQSYPPIRLPRMVSSFGGIKSTVARKGSFRSQERPPWGAPRPQARGGDLRGAGLGGRSRPARLLPRPPPQPLLNQPC